MDTAKVRLGCYIVQKAKIRYDWVLINFKCQNKVRLEFYFVDNAKIGYG